MHHAAPIGKLNNFELQYRPANMSHLPPLSAPPVSTVSQRMRADRYRVAVPTSQHVTSSAAQRTTVKYQFLVPTRSTCRLHTPSLSACAPVKYQDAVPAHQHVTRAAVQCAIMTTITSSQIRSCVFSNINQENHEYFFTLELTAPAHCNI